MSELKARLRLHSISQSALAKRAGYSPREVSRWLRGHVAPELKAMLTLDEACDEIVASKVN